MSGDNIANALYLGLLLAAIGGSMILHFRGKMGQMAQIAAIWVLIFIGVIAAFGLWGDIRGSLPGQQTTFSQGGEIQVTRARDGHYHLTLELDGTPVDFLVDTGASEIVLTKADARRIGVNLDDLRFSGRANTANGVVRTARVWIETVSLGGITQRGVPAQVSEGEMPGSLLGMSYLSRFASIKIEQNTLTLVH